LPVFFFAEESKDNIFDLVSSISRRLRAVAENSSREIEALEKREVDKILKNDLETLGRLWSDHLIAASNENLILTKRQLFALFDGGLIQIQSVECHFSKTFVTGSSAFVIDHQQTVSKIGPKQGWLNIPAISARGSAEMAFGSWLLDIQPLWQGCLRETVNSEVPSGALSCE
jgi:hypothetical protein